MKCPDCNTVCSELRDICPTCFVDFRDFKKESGLPISYPNDSYETLLLKYGHQIIGDSDEYLDQSNQSSLSSSKPKISVLAPIINLFRDASNKPILRKDPQNDEGLRPAAPQDKQVEQSNISNITTSIETEDLEPPVYPGEQLGSLPEATETHQLQTMLSEQVSFEDLPSDQNHEASLVEQIYEDPNLNNCLDTTSPNSLTATNISTQDQTQNQDQIPQAARKWEFHKWAFQNSPELSQDLSDGSFDVVSFDTSLDPLFADCLKELVEKKEEEEIELSAENFFNIQGREDIEVLFEMAKESLLDPESEKRYVDRVNFTLDRTVEAETASIHLREFEKLLSAPALSLRGAAHSISISGQSASGMFDDNEAVNQKVASSIKRILSCVLDILTAFLFSCKIATTILVSTTYNINTILAGSARLAPIDLVNFVHLSALLILVVFPMICFFSLMFYSSTPGSSLFGIGVRSPMGRKIGIAQSLVWSLSLPLSFVTFSPVLSLFGKSSLHEWAAKARPVLITV